MASFTDSQNIQILTSFNPYVQQLPIEKMEQVGVAKQQMYNEGVQKIQTNIDNVAGMDVIRDVDKAYLQSKVNELSNNLRSVAAGDFSNFQLVNSVSGMTNQIVKDKNVQNAVSSTMKFRKEQAAMESDKAAGKLSPDNEYYFTKQANGWINSSDVKQGFNGKYIPNFDVFKYAKETFDAVKPDGMSFDQIYTLDAQGKPVKDRNGNLIYSPTMTRMEKEGLFPEKVKQTLEQIFSDPRVGQQLNITGQYNYRNLGAPELSKRIEIQKQSLLGDYTDRLNTLTLQKSLGKNVDKEMDSLTAQINSINENYSSYEELAYDNPDVVRGAMYKDDVSSRYTTMFGHITTKEQILENPAWRASFDLQKEANAQSRFAQELRQRKIEHSDDMGYKYTSLAQTKEIEAAKLEAIKNKPGYGKPGTNGNIPTQANQPSTIDQIKLQTDNYEKSAIEFSSATDDLLWQTIFGKQPINQQNLQKYVSRGIPEEKAKSMMIDAAAKQKRETPEAYRTRLSQQAVTLYNNLSPTDKEKNSSVVDAYNNFKQKKRIFNSEVVVNQQVASESNQLLGKIANNISLEDIKPQTVSLYGKQYTLSKEDIVDLAVYLKGNESVLSGTLGDDNIVSVGKQAQKRLEARGKGEFLQGLIRKEGLTTGGPLTVFTRLLTNAPGYIKDVFYSDNPEKIDFSQVKRVYNILDKKEFSEGLKKKAEIINRAYGVKPNLQQSLVTGNEGVDKVIYNKLKVYSSDYAQGKNNLSPDFEKFVSTLNAVKDLKSANIKSKVVMDQNNNPQVETVISDSNGKRIGGMVLQPDEALGIGIDINNLYENREVSALRNNINYSSNKSTSVGDPTIKSTYIQGDSYFDKNDFPAFKNSRYDVQGNVMMANGLYYPIIYINDGTTSKVRPFPGMNNPEEALQALINVTPTLANQILIEK